MFEGWKTIQHVLWLCSTAWDVWVEKKSPIPKWSSQEEEFLHLWEMMQTSFKRETLEELAEIYTRVSSLEGTESV